MRFRTNMRVKTNMRVETQAWKEKGQVRVPLVFNRVGWLIQQRSETDSQLETPASLEDSGVPALGNVTTIPDTV